MCTNFRYSKARNLNISARTMDFSVEINSKIMAVSKNVTPHESIAPEGSTALNWDRKYNYIALNGFNVDIAADGLNEAGLSAAALWLPDSVFPDISQLPQNKNFLALQDVIDFTLSTCKNVIEVQSTLSEVNIWGAPFAPLAAFGLDTLPIHIVFHDTNGQNLVMEILDGKPVFNNNLEGVMTNNPPLAWHQTNMINYVNLSRTDAATTNIAGMRIEKSGDGSGMLGLPGDATPPSRYIRAVAMTQCAQEVASTEEAVTESFRLIDNVIVQRGITSSHDYTQWFIVRDHDNKAMYYRTYDGSKTQRLAIDNIDFDSLTERVYLSLSTEFTVDELSINQE